MIPTEHPPAKVSSILISYDRLKDNIHPIIINYYAKETKRSVNFIVKVPSTNEELKQELRTSMKSGRKYDYESDRLAVGFAEGGEGMGV
jgi:hypothetical protein